MRDQWGRCAKLQMCPGVMSRRACMSDGLLSEERSSSIASLQASVRAVLRFFFTRFRFAIMRDSCAEKVSDDSSVISDRHSEAVKQN